MNPIVLAFFAFIFVLFCRFLKFTSQAHKPVLFFRDEKFAKVLLDTAPILEEKYVPTKLWGFCGHIQTALHSILGRLKCPWPIGERVSLILPDGATLTYDIYQPLDIHTSGDDVTLALCPGICNSSESIYIRTFVHHAQRQGYRCVVLNHIGALKSVKLSSHRIFSYGCPRDFDTMLSHMLENYPQTKVVAVGFSMGANIVTKFLGKGKTAPSNIIGGISICQGYDALGSMRHMLQWTNFRRFYLYCMTENMKRLLMAHQQIVLHEDVKNRFQLCERTILSAATLPEFDEAYTRRIHGYSSIKELYESSSCAVCMNDINVPMVFINALDDPIVHESLLTWPMNFAQTHDKALYIQTAHGGHIGFYEGGFIKPNLVTWLDRTAVSLADGMLQITRTKDEIQY